MTKFRQHTNPKAVDETVTLKHLAVVALALIPFGALWYVAHTIFAHLVLSALPH